MAKAGYECLNPLDEPWGKFIAYCPETEQAWLLVEQEQPKVPVNPSQPPPRNFKTKIIHAKNIHHIDEHPPGDGWIKTEERLPECGVFVDTYGMYLDRVVCAYLLSCEENTWDSALILSNAFGRLKKPTHWRPISKQSRP